MSGRTYTRVYAHACVCVWEGKQTDRGWVSSSSQIYVIQGISLDESHGHRINLITIKLQTEGCRLTGPSVPRIET